MKQFEASFKAMSSAGLERTSEADVWLDDDVCIMPKTSTLISSFEGAVFCVRSMGIRFIVIYDLLLYENKYSSTEK